jgi:hypothetical protein
MSRAKKNNYTMGDLHADGRAESRQVEAAKREEDFVNWIHALGATLRQVRHASDLSEKELAARLNGRGPDLALLDTGFSDRVQIGDIKIFVDACEGSLEIIVRDKKGEIVSERAIVGTAPPPSKGAGPSGSLDRAQIDTLADLVVRKLVERLSVALGAAVPAREEGAGYSLHEDPASFEADTDKVGGSHTPKK